MAFVPRTFEEIRDDMIAFVRMQTDLTDFEVGSVIRTIIEAAALEDDEQYFQMVQLLDAFRLSTSTGKDLDDRVADYGLLRLSPESATGDITISNGNLATGLLEFSAAAGATVITLQDSSLFPTSGFPVNIRIGEGTTIVADTTIIANNTSTHQLTLGTLLANTYDITSLGNVRVSVVSGSDKALTTGIRVQVPSTTGSSTIFVTVETGTIVSGNYDSTPIKVRAETPGTDGNIGAGKVTQFASSPPFDGALVRNIANFAGGRDIETDSELIDRARAAIQALSRGTILALQEGVLGVEDTVTGQRVTTVNILESFVTNEVVVYVDDGTGFVPDQVELTRMSILTGGVVAAGAPQFTVNTTVGLPEEGYILVSPEDVSQREILAFSGVDHSTNIISLVGTTAHNHDHSDEVVLIDLIEDDAESGENFFQLSNFPVIRSSYRLWVDDGSTVQFKQEGIDYFLNRGTGQIEFIGSGVAAGTRIGANYAYYTALLAQVQKVIDGDPTNPSTYPGLRAAGIRAVVETPVIRRVSVRCSITAKSGFQEVDLTPAVQETIESYINGLGIGDDVIIAEIVRRAMTITGVQDVVVILPTTNIVVLENELPRPVDINGNTLVTVN
jgi:uncharacterized phage protein gp47/JayE